MPAAFLERYRLLSLSKRRAWRLFSVMALFTVGVETLMGGLVYSSIAAFPHLQHGLGAIKELRVVPGGRAVSEGTFDDLSRESADFRKRAGLDDEDLPAGAPA